MPKPIAELFGGATNDKIINTLILDLVRNSYDKPCLLFSQEIFEALQALMRFNSEYIYFNPKIKTETPKIKNMFYQMFNKYCDDLANDKFSKICSYFLQFVNNDYRKRNSPKRIAVDFIAGMTDDFFRNEYQQAFVPQSYGYTLPERG